MVRVKGLVGMFRVRVRGRAMHYESLYKDESTRMCVFVCPDARYFMQPMN